MRLMKFFICLIGLAFFQDVSGQSIAELNAKIANLETKIVVLETKVSMLEENNKALNLRIDNVLLNMKSGSITNNPEIKSSQNNNIQQQNTVAVPKVSTSENTNSSSSGQCAATTKKGSRCSRRASSNGYCWQHGGN
jgi:hypothetical protein